MNSYIPSESGMEATEKRFIPAVIPSTSSMGPTHSAFQVSGHLTCSHRITNHFSRLEQY